MAPNFRQESDSRLSSGTVQGVVGVDGSTIGLFSPRLWAPSESTIFPRGFTSAIEELVHLKIPSSPVVKTAETPIRVCMTGRGPDMSG